MSLHKNTLKRLENEAKATDLLNQYMADKAYKLHHSAFMRGYVKRSTGGYAVPYSGHYGVGVAVHIPDFKGTEYHHVYYFIKEEK